MLDLPSQTHLQRVVHASTWRYRQACISALLASDDPAQAKRARKMHACSCSGQYVLPSDRTPYLRLDRCSKRLCPLCSRLRASRVRRTLKSWFAGKHDLRHIVLTVPHTGVELRDAITSIMQMFARFRRSPDWKTHVSGGMYCLEVARKQDADDWHVHLHVVVSGMYWRQRDLAESWSAVVGHDAIVWISRAGDRHASYLAKYIGAPEKLHLLDPSLIREYEYGIHGRRMIQSFGSWHGAVEDRDETLPLPSGTEMMDAGLLLSMRAHGHLGAIRLYDVLAMRYPMLRSQHWHPPPLVREPDETIAESIDAELNRIRYFVRKIMRDYVPPKRRYRKASQAV